MPVMINLVTLPDEVKFTLDDFTYLSTATGGQAVAGYAAGTHVEHLESGDLKMIASANRTRHSYAPDTATLIEQGYDVYVDPWFYFAMSAGSSAEAQAATAPALAAALETDEVKAAVRNALNTEVENLGPEATKKMLVDGIDKVKVLFGK